MQFYDEEDKLAFINRQYLEMLNREGKKLPILYLIYEDLQDEDNLCFYGSSLSSVTKFNFGKYKGEEVKKVFEEDVSYLIWCILNVEKFMITREEMLIILEKYKEDYGFSKNQRQRIEDVYEAREEKMLKKLRKMRLIGYDNESY